jgi:hypothetical protein
MYKIDQWKQKKAGKKFFMQLWKESSELKRVSKKQAEMLYWFFLSLSTQAQILQPLAHVQKVLI